MKHYSSSHDEETYEHGEGGALPYLKMVGNIHHWCPFLTFSNPILSLFMHNSILLNPSVGRKIYLSVSHFVPEIIWPKVGLFKKKNLSFDIFEAICITLLLHFRSCWTPFSLLLDLFDTSFLQNLRSCWVHFLSHAGPPSPPLKIWWSAPPPGLWDDHLQLLI